MLWIVLTSCLCKEERARETEQTSQPRAGYFLSVFVVDLTHPLVTHSFDRGILSEDMETNLGVIHESPASTVYKTRVPYDRSFASGYLSVVKSASACRAYSPEPHDILKEAHIISQVSHKNVSE